jgi:hypothetical protein
VTGKPRPRPNKWYIEGDHDNHSEGKTFDTWKEWSYATDENGQCYYSERWERLPGDELGNGLRLAMRKRLQTNNNTAAHVDAILVAVGVSSLFVFRILQNYLIKYFSSVLFFSL